MKGNERKQKRWERNRSEAYRGSMLHFMRTVYRNTLAQEGFEVRFLQKIPNYEKKRVREAYKANMRSTKTSDGKIMVSSINEDSSNYYSRILSQEDQQDLIGKTILPGDSIAFAEDSLTAALTFNNYLLVIYKNKLVPVEYKRQFPKSSTAMMSQIVLVNQNPVYIQANGSFFNPTELMSLGYWSWSEKMATMLPFDYKARDK
jgi:hypothetical protein